MAAQASKVRKIVKVTKTIRDYYPEYSEDMDRTAARIIEYEWMKHLKVLETMFLKKDFSISDESIILSQKAYKLLEFLSFPNISPDELTSKLSTKLPSGYEKAKQKERQENFVTVKLSECYPEEYSSSVITAMKIWEKHLEILSKVLLEDDWFRSEDAHTIFVSKSIRPLLTSLKGCPIDEFEKRLRQKTDEITFKYREFKQIEVQKKDDFLSVFFRCSDKSSEASSGNSDSTLPEEPVSEPHKDKIKEDMESFLLSLSDASGISFFKISIMSLEAIAKVLNTIGTFGQTFDVKKDHLSMECPNVDAWAAKEFVRLLQLCGVNAALRQKASNDPIVRVFGIIDENKFKQEDTQEILQKFAAVVRLYPYLTQNKVFGGTFAYKDRFAGKLNPHLRIEGRGIAKKEVESLADSLRRDCFVDACMCVHGSIPFLAVFGVTDSDKFLEKGAQEKLQSLLASKNSSSKSSVSISKGPG